MIHQAELTVATRGRGTYDLTRELARVVRESGAQKGMCNAFVHHTSASLIVCENADPDVRADLERFLARLVRDGDPIFVHTAEGPDDMSAHIRSVLTNVSVTLPVARGKCLLGTWQGLYLYEHRSSPHDRRVTVTVYGE